MQLLIVAATGAEIAPFTRYIQNASGMRVTCDVLIPGIGMVATTYALTKQLQLHHYDLVIQAGIGGSFDTTLALGVLVFVTSEQYGDMGAEDHDNYIDIFEMGLLQANDTPFSSGKLINPLSELHSNILLPHVSGLTVNTVSGNESSIKRRSEKYQCQVESMEGAAFHYV